MFVVLLISAPLSQKLEPPADPERRIASSELATDAERKKLLERYAEELMVRFPEWENLQVCVVAGAGFEPAAFRL